MEIIGKVKFSPAEVIQPGLNEARTSGLLWTRVLFLTCVMYNCVATISSFTRKKLSAEGSSTVQVPE